MASPSPCTICGNGYKCLSCYNTPSSDIVGSVCSCYLGETFGSSFCLGIFSEENFIEFIFIACESLDSNCLQCSSTSTCTACSGSLLKYGPNCVASCPIESYKTGSSCIGKKLIEKIVILIIEKHAAHCIRLVLLVTVQLPVHSAQEVLSRGVNHVKHPVQGVLTIMEACVLVKIFVRDLLLKILACKTLDNYCTSCNSSITCTGCSNSKYALASKCVDSCPGDNYINAGVCTCKL